MCKDIYKRWYKNMTFSADSSLLSGVGMHSEVGVEFTKRSLSHQKDYQKRLLQYEKEFNINLTRINSSERDVQRSMLAYSQKVADINKVRFSVSEPEPKEDTSTLHVRARHIPKSVHLPKLSVTKRTSVKRSPAIYKARREEVYRESNSYSGSSTDSDSFRFVSQRSKRLSSSKEELQMKLASAADLCELANYRLPRRHKGSGFSLLSKYQNDSRTDNSSSKVFSIPAASTSTSDFKEESITQNDHKDTPRPPPIDNKTMVKAIVKLRQMDRKLTIFNSKKYRKFKLQRSRLDAIPETESGEDEYEENAVDFQNLTSDRSRRSTSRSSGSPVSLKPTLEAIPEIVKSKTLNKSQRTEINVNDIEISHLSIDSTDTSTTPRDTSKEVSNFEKARKQMKQKTKSKKLKFLKAS